MNTRLVIKILFIVVILSLIASNIYVYAFGKDFDPSKLQANGNSDVSKINNAFSKVFNTVILILQILSVGGIIFAGVKLMLTTNAADRADMFESLKFLIIGMVIVFGASSIIKFVVNITTDVIRIK